MSKTIVHVDDDEDIRSVVETILKKSPYKLINYATVEEFFVSVNNDKPDLVLMDVMVEEIDAGLKAYDQYKEKYPETPVILLTSLGEMVSSHFEGGGEGVPIVEKPIDPAGLLSLIKQFLGE